MVFHDQETRTQIYRHGSTLAIYSPAKYILQYVLGYDPTPYYQERTEDFDVKVVGEDACFVTSMHNYNLALAKLKELLKDVDQFEPETGQMLMRYDT